MLLWLALSSAGFTSFPKHGVTHIHKESRSHMIHTTQMTTLCHLAGLIPLAKTRECAMDHLQGVLAFLKKQITLVFASGRDRY